MHKIRKAAALGCVSVALLFGLAAPAQAGGQTVSPAGGATTYSVPSPFHFGTWTEQWACHYYGQQMVTYQPWNSYICRWMVDGARGTGWELWLTV